MNKRTRQPEQPPAPANLTANFSFLQRPATAEDGAGDVAQAVIMGEVGQRFAAYVTALFQEHEAGADSVATKQALRATWQQYALLGNFCQHRAKVVIFSDKAKAEGDRTPRPVCPLCGLKLIFVPLFFAVSAQVPKRQRASLLEQRKALLEDVLK